MKKIFPFFCVIFCAFSSSLHAAPLEQFPNVSGKVFIQTEVDRIMSTNVQGVAPNNAFLYAQSDLSLNLNRNWSFKTQWRLQPNKVLTTRNGVYPERYRTFLQSGRGVNLDQGLLVEELKLQFENEDMRFFIGKFDPTFGTVYNKSKRIGVFTSQFGEDYNLREKLGFGVVGLLESSEISFNSFFNDNTGLSNSALQNRGRANQNSNYAGDTGTLSSYSISMKGEDFFGVENWFYNVGYRSLGVSKVENRAREKGYVFGSEYLHKLGKNTSLIPFFEYTKIDNFAAFKGRNAQYSTLALIGKYSSWTASVSRLARSISHYQGNPTLSDHQLQLSVGYKFANNLTLDVSRSSFKESNHSGVMVGAVLGYLYEF